MAFLTAGPAWPSIPALFCLCLSVSGRPAGYCGPADCVVKLRPGYRSEAALRDLCADFGCAAKAPQPLLGHAALKADNGSAASTLRERLRNDARVASVQPDYRVDIAQDRRASRDPDSHRQWGLYDTDGDRSDIRAPEAWRLFRGSRRIVIGIVDTGIDYLHPDLAANAWVNLDEIPGNGIDDDHNDYVDDRMGWDFAAGRPDPMDRHGHGTHVAGTAGAVGDNGVGISGVSQRVSLMAVKGLGDAGYGYSWDLAVGIVYAVDNGAQVINISWGGGGYADVTVDAIQYARNHNVVVVAAVGNNSRNIDATPFYPASYDIDNIVTVAALAQNGRLASFSNVGYHDVDLAAPGGDIWSTFPGGRYATMHGTSMAAPQVTGALALLMGCSPGLTYHKYIDAIAASAAVLQPLHGLVNTGGTLDVERALRAIMPGRLAAASRGSREPAPRALQYLTRAIQPE